MFKEMTKKTKIIIVVVIIAVIVAVVLIVRHNRKKKKLAAALQQPDANSNYHQTDQTPPMPRTRFVPKEDQVREVAPEPALSVEQVIPEKKQEQKPVATGAPGTLGVPVNNSNAAPGNGKKAAANNNNNNNNAGGGPAKSSLPPEFMINANDPNAG